MSGALLRKINFWRGCFYVCLWICAFALGWLNLVSFVSHISMAALVETAFMGYVASRAEDAAETDS